MVCRDFCGRPVVETLHVREGHSGCPPPGDLPNPGIEPKSPILQVDSLPTERSGKSLSKRNQYQKVTYYSMIPFIRHSGKDKLWSQGIGQCGQKLRVRMRLDYTGRAGVRFFRGKEGVVVMESFCILFVAVVTQIYTC